MPSSRSGKYIPGLDFDARRKANELRQELGLGDKRYVDLNEVLEKIKLKYPQFKLIRVADSRLKAAEAKAVSETFTLTVRAGILDALRKYPDARARWTIAHELAHLFLSHPGRHFRKRLNRFPDRMEREADTFASEFLAPTRLLNGLSPDDIRLQFGLSMQAAMKRHEEFKSFQRLEGKQLTGLDESTQNELKTEVRQSVDSQIDDSRRLATADVVAFVAMKFDADMDRLYRDVLKPAIEAAKIRCHRADEVSTTSSIAENIKRLIKESHLVVAEISGNNPNVIHEIGFAQALEKPTILICSDSCKEDDIPFNIRHISRIEYRNNAGGGPTLARELTRTLRAIVDLLD
jgi:hypothetical protein